MSIIEKNTPGTPSITSEAKQFDMMQGGVQEGIRQAAYLDRKIKAAEKEQANMKPKMPEPTPVVTPKDIEEEMNR